ncbi:MAG: hypothetical protein GTN62_04635 [Gemmatimonadales bacterium]|nr:hypothetical protein [Gemmatimonadales bacterium]NIN10624.1 hypothetical protein [Gemmatimonadales bacterium]NIN49386.1 hypothetical protein [Gemmatimonadales bacterium]NIP06850.1 hypothetical protein [Gemmatimonadales bacterium]NIR01524.1 hypothetical protein [Gemmatimonadales bacterium]
MTWWCFAQGTAWEWTWRPYPGVWLLAALLIGGYVAALRRLRPPGEPIPARRGQIVSFVLGVLALWLAADWPVGPLGAGYLVSVHTGQYLLFALVAPPLLIHGTPAWLLRLLIKPRPAYHTARFLSRPLIAFAIFNVVLLATHLPTLVDRLTVSQLGSFLMDMTWLASGLVFWWQVLGPLPELHPLSYPARILFLILNVFIPTVPAAFLTFADYPLYALYELAPRAVNLSARQDQQLAGLIMKVVGGLIIFGTASVLFFKWHGMEEREEGRM